MVEHFCEPALCSTHRHGFAIHHSQRDWLAVLSIDGEVDMATAPHLGRAICEALEKSATGSSSTSPA